MCEHVSSHIHPYLCQDEHLFVTVERQHGGKIHVYNNCALYNFVLYNLSERFSAGRTETISNKANRKNENKSEPEPKSKAWWSWMLVQTIN